MAKTALDKANENEPLNKKLKTIKLDDQKRSATDQQKDDVKSKRIEQQANVKQPNQSKQSKQTTKKSKQQQSDKSSKKPKQQHQLDKSSKLKANDDQPKSDEVRKQRQLRKQKKKQDRLNKKKPNQAAKQNLNLNTEQKLSSIFHQENENNKTIINHYKNLAAKVNGDSVNGFVKQIKELILDVHLDKELKNYLVNELYRYINISSSQQNNETLMMLMKFIALNALFPARDDDNVVKNIEQDTISCFKNCFIKTVSLIVRNSSNKKKKEIENAKLDQLYQITKYVYSLLNAEGAGEPDEKENYNQIFKKISNAYKQVQLKEDKREQSILAAFFLFYVFLGVNVFDEDCMQIVGEVNECFKRFSSHKPSDDLHWADVFTDIILSLLATASSLKRSVCDEVFGLISKEITNAGLEQLMTALISDNVEISDDEQSDDDEEFIDAQEQLDDAEELDEEEEQDEESDDEEDNVEDQEAEQNETKDEEDEINDLEVDENCEIEKELVVEESEDGSSDESDDDDLDGETDNESVDDEFRRKIKDALGKAAIESDEDEIIYDDEQMFKGGFDEAISKVFKEKKKIKNKTQELTEFKSRCFDLVQILLNTKNVDFLIEIAKNTLQVLSNNNNPKSYDLILKASTALKKYQTIEHSKLEVNEEKSTGIEELLKTSLRLVQKLPEKVRSNLNCFIVWLLDLCKTNQSTEIEKFILNNLDKKLKKASEISLLIQLAERKKHLAQSIFNQLIKIDLNTSLTNFELYSYYKLIIACCLNLDQSIFESAQTAVKAILNKTVENVNQKKKNKKAKFVIEESIRFLTIFIKNNLSLVKSDVDLMSKLVKLGDQTLKLKLNRKLRQKWKHTQKLFE